MGSKTYTDLINVVRGNLDVKNEDAKVAAICNIATELFWKSYDWRESLTELAPFWLIPNVQDYGAKVNAVPADFNGLRTARLVRVTTSPPTIFPDILISRDIRPTHTRAVPTQIGYSPAVQAFRIFNRAPETMGTGEWLVGGTYKKTAPQVTPNTLSTIKLFTDDRHFYAWVPVIKWAYAEIVGLPAGAAAALLPAAMGAINAVASDEGFNLASPTIAPSEGLASGIWNSGAGYFGPFF